jgi:hypothetical protein
MELAVITLVIASSLTATVVPLVAHWVTLQPQTRIDSIMTPVADLIPPPLVEADTLILSPAAVRAARRH